MSDKRVKPVGDVFMIEIGTQEENPLGMVGAKTPEEGVKEGIVIAIGEEPQFFGFQTFAFDKSLNAPELLKEVYEHYKGFVGKRVYWPERSESGTDITVDGKTYVFVKWASIIGVEV